MSRVFEKKMLQFQPFIESVVELFHPFVEVAVHDLKAGRVVAIYHNISRRKVGEATPLDEVKGCFENFPDHFPPYHKKNWDGRNLKCSSITLRDDAGEPIGLVCINVDTTFFSDTREMMEAFLSVSAGSENPLERFGGDCGEAIERMVEGYLSENRLSLKRLSRAQKRDAVHYLYHRGAFNYKSAPPFIAERLQISRATVYNYLREIGK